MSIGCLDALTNIVKTEKQETFDKCLLKDKLKEYVNFLHINEIKCVSINDDTHSIYIDKIDIGIRINISHLEADLSKNLINSIVNTDIEFQEDENMNKFFVVYKDNVDLVIDTVKCLVKNFFNGDADKINIALLSENQKGIIQLRIITILFGVLMILLIIYIVKLIF